MLVGLLDYLAIGSLLDVGSGTGRVITYVKKAKPDLMILGVEPVQELREVAYEKGISPAELTDGDALDLRCGDGAFDLVCAFGVLHHIRTPEIAIGEMLRVAKKAISSRTRTISAKALGLREASSKP